MPIPSTKEFRNISAALIAASRAKEQIQPIRDRADQALRRSRELLSLPVYPHER